MQSLTAGAAQQRVLRLLEGQEACNVELDPCAAQQTVLRLLEGQETFNVELDCWSCTADSVTVIRGTGNM